MKIGRLLAIMSLLLTPIVAYAQRSPMKKGEQLDKLNFLIGRWDVRGTRNTPKGELKTDGTLVYEWVVGGVWLQELTKAETADMGTVFNLRLLTFDANSGEYVGTVLDNLNSRTYPVRMKWLDDQTLESIIEVEGKNQQNRR